MVRWDNLNIKMSLDKSGRRESARVDFDASIWRGKGSYTEEGFYRRNPPPPPMNLSDISQKESLYEQRVHNAGVNPHQSHHFSGLHPLNPTDTSTIPVREDDCELLQDIQITRLKEKNIILEERLRHKEIFINQMTVVQQ